MNRKLYGGVLAVVLSAAASVGHAASMTFDPTADGDVQVFGGDDVDTADTVLSFTQSGGLIRNVVLEYDLSAIADGSTINSASLEFTQTRFISPAPSVLNPSPTAEVDIFAYSGDGVVNIADFDAAGTQVVDATIPGGGGPGDTQSFSFSSLVPISSSLVGDLLTVRVETDSFASFQIASLENGTFAAPQLTIDYTPAVTNPPAIPLPAGFPLLLAGLGAFALVRRKA